MRWSFGDIALAVAMAVLGVATAAGADRGTRLDRPVDAVAFVLAMLAGLTLAGRRRWPLATLAAVAVLVSTYLTLGYPYALTVLAVPVAVYTVARHLPLSRSAPASAFALALLMIHLLTHNLALPGIHGIVTASAWVVVPFAVGVTVKVTREAAARARAEAVRQRLDDERLRVAHDVHDVVGHGLAAIKMQADVALHLLATKPEQAEKALNAISHTSDEALDELRTTLAAVSQAQQEALRSPGPGLSRLEDLRRRMDEAGLRVRLQITGSPRDLPAPVDMAGYRVVQESLTNVLRHSEASEASVRIGYESDAVVITVSNAASQAASGRKGFGIPGMRGRVTSLGGEFTAGPVPGGRFEVHARIPTDADS